MNQFQSKKFKTLQKRWYLKLKESGFKEIEDTESSFEYLKDWHSHHFQKKYEPQTFEANETYYRMASGLLHLDTFKSDSEKKIWAMHADGIAIRKIAAALSIKVWVVHRTITDLEKKMRLLAAELG